MSQPARRVALRVLEPGQCPVFVKDDVVVFDGRGLDLALSTAVCAEALCDIYALVVRDVVAQAGPGPIPPVQIPCAYKGCGARFQLQDAPPTVADTRRLAEVGESGPFLQRLPEEEAAVIAAVAEDRDFVAGTLLIEHAQLAEYLYVLVEGEVEVFVPAEDERDEETIIITLGPGDCFGEISLLTGQPTTAGVRTMTGCRALVIDSDRFQRLLEISPVLNRLFTQIVYERFCAANRDIRDEKRADYKGRLRSVGITDLLQGLGQSRRTGVMSILSGDDLARLGFVEGAPRGMIVLDVSSVPRNERFQPQRIWGLTPVDRGMSAFFRIFDWEDGEFRFSEGDEELRGDVGCDLMTLLMEGARRVDESAR